MFQNSRHNDTDGIDVVCEQPKQPPAKDDTEEASESAGGWQDGVMS